ncbi:tRNA lysidine(34) synthetase TilS [Spongorhabdus nitratireducens]
MDFLQRLEQTLSRFVPDLQQADFVVGYSGGMDSTVLLDAMCQLRDAGRLKKLRAVHVHHGLNQQADAWVKDCESFCAHRNISLVVRKVVLPDHCPDGVELAAREARYWVFESSIGDNAFLLQAHHQRDQAETFLFRALRGSGIGGLSGIPAIRPLGAGYILRPLLNSSWESLSLQAEQRQLQWIEDDSNSDDRFDRNFLRLNILPLLESRWPEGQKKLAEASRDCAESAQLLQELVRGDFDRCVAAPRGLFLDPAIVLDCDKLQSLSVIRQRHVLRYWLDSQGFLMPSRVVLERMLQEVIVAREDAEPEVCWAGVIVRRYKKQLVVCRVEPEVAPVTKVWSIAQSRSFDLGANGLLSFKGDVVAETKLNIHYRNELDSSGKFALQGRKGSKTLKRWLQDSGVPPWLRNRVPLLYCQGKLFAIPGVGLVSGIVQPEEGCNLQFYWAPTANLPARS